MKICEAIHAELDDMEEDHDAAYLRAVKVPLLKTFLLEWAAKKPVCTSLFARADDLACRLDITRGDRADAEDERARIKWLEARGEEAEQAKRAKLKERQAEEEYAALVLAWTKECQSLNEAGGKW
jgi:hypothetical protein